MEVLLEEELCSWWTKRPRRRCCTRLPAKRMEEVPTLGWYVMRAGTCTAQPSMAAFPGQPARFGEYLAAEPCLCWIKQAKKQCSTVSREGRTGQTRRPLW